MNMDRTYDFKDYLFVRVFNPAIYVWKELQKNPYYIYKNKLKPS